MFGLAAASARSAVADVVVDERDMRTIVERQSDSIALQRPDRAVGGKVATRSDQLLARAWR